MNEWTNQKSMAVALGMVLVMATPYAWAEDEAPASLAEELAGKWQGLSFEGLGITFGSWVEGGVTYNSDSPDSNFNGLTQFNDRDGEFQLNQWYAYAERAVTPGQWDVGFRVDALFGTDARFTKATGLDDDLLIDRADERFYQFALPQLYVSAGLPVDGLSARLGRFYTLIGNEVIPAPSNFFYSHSYTFFYAEPFTHTGLIFDYAPSDQWTFSAGAVIGPDDNGFDNFSNYGSTNFLGGAGWTSKDEATSAYVAVTTGAVGDSDDDRTISSIVFNQQLLGNLKFTFQGDYGVQEVAVGGVDAEWYGAIGYLTYDVNDQLAAGVRAEWFHDDDGLRTGFDNIDLYSFTAGVNWKPLQWVTVRPEVRYDFSDSAVDPFDDGNEDDQFLFATDFIITLL